MIVNELGYDSSDEDCDILAAKMFFDMKPEIQDSIEVDIGVGVWEDDEPCPMIKCTRLNYEEKIKQWWSIAKYN